MDKIFKINPKDNVAIALDDIKAGESFELDGAPLTARQDISRGHKIALCPIDKGACVVKYGYPIGTASESIQTGDWVHVHNVKTRLGDLLEYTYTPSFYTLPQAEQKTFQGYIRQNGKAGIRNEVWIIPTVGCVNAIAKAIEDASQKFCTPQIDGIFSYSHPYGCSQMGEDHINTQKALCGLIQHPNAGAVLVVALGCENNTVEQMKARLGEYDPQRVKFIVCQEHEDEIADGVEMVRQLCRYASQFKRESCPASMLTVGLKCGGSDGLSGVTANPLVGAFSDLLVARGGTSILTEVPEMFGAETILMNRCKDEKTFEKTVGLINHFKQYFIDRHQSIDSNPSPGNKAGGITTLEDKSLGCIQKGGYATVNDVLIYGQPVSQKGLNLLQAPGNDLVASLATAISGANLVLFTTGRGTPFGCPVPTVKISSNTPLSLHKAAWIDFNAGCLIEGMPMEQLSEMFFDYVLEVASGRRTKSENFDKRDLAIFKDGVTL